MHSSSQQSRKSKTLLYACIHAFTEGLRKRKEMIKLKMMITPAACMLEILIEELIAFNLQKFLRNMVSFNTVILFFSQFLIEIQNKQESQEDTDLLNFSKWTRWSKQKPNQMGIKLMDEKLKFKSAREINQEIQHQAVTWEEKETHLLNITGQDVLLKDHLAILIVRKEGIIINENKNITEEDQDHVIHVTNKETEKDIDIEMLIDRGIEMAIIVESVALQMIMIEEGEESDPKILIQPQSQTITNSISISNIYNNQIQFTVQLHNQLNY